MAAASSPHHLRPEHTRVVDSRIKEFKASRICLPASLSPTSDLNPGHCHFVWFLKLFLLTVICSQSWKPMVLFHSAHFADRTTEAQRKFKRTPRQSQIQVSRFLWGFLHFIKPIKSRAGFCRWKGPQIFQEWRLLKITCLYSPLQPNFRTTSQQIVIEEYFLSTV